MAFTTPELKAFYAVHWIQDIPTGPRTPWPNRAETAVRLFKTQYKIICQTLQEEPSLHKVTLRHIVQSCVWARHNQRTRGGRTLLEMATGRRPPDMFDTESMNPEQVSVDTPEKERLDHEVKSWL